jgi:hypothetical protein
MAGHHQAETRDNVLTSPSREKRYGLDISQQRQEIMAGHHQAETRDNVLTSPSRDKRYGLPNSR